MEPITLASLLTIPGAVIAVLIVAQYTKSWIPQRFDTRLYVLLLALVFTQGALFIAGAGWVEHVLMVINGFVVATSAMGSYDTGTLNNFRATDDAKRLAARTVDIDEPEG